MASVYTDQATAQLAPVYDQQIKNVEGQLPAIESLYANLFKGLEGTAATQTQGIMEGAQQRGVLRSSLTTDLQTGLGEAIIAQKGQLGAQKAKEIAGINSQVGELNIQKVKSIQDLSQQLQAGALSEREYQFKVTEANRNYELEKQKLAIASKQANAAAQKGAPAGLVNAVFSVLTKYKGRDGFVSPEVFRAAQNSWTAKGGSPSSFLETYGWAVNPKHQERFGGYY